LVAAVFSLVNCTPKKFWSLFSVTADAILVLPPGRK